MAFVNVQGEVTRLHNSGGGFSLRESWQTKDGDRSRYWAVFPKAPVSVAVGDRVKVSGGLQTKVTEPKEDGRVFVDHTVGQAQVEVVQASQQGQGGGNGAGWHNPSPAQSSGVTSDSGFGNGFDQEPF